METQSGFFDANAPFTLWNRFRGGFFCGFYVKAISKRIRLFVRPFFQMRLPCNGLLVRLTRDLHSDKIFLQRNGIRPWQKLTFANWAHGAPFLGKPSTHLDLSINLMDNSRLTYSTDSGRICPSCERPIKKCVCKKKQRTETKEDGIVRIRREVKGRKGKTVTVVYGFEIEDNELRNIAKELKRQCGTGGSAIDGTIIIQGDHREKILAELKDRGFNVKLAGG